MSFVITAYVREGIVMAADSRLFLNTQKSAGPSITNLISVGQSDSNQKLFVTKSGVGISTVGDADIKGVPIAGFIEQFVIQTVADNQWSPEKVADEIINHFNSQPVVPNTQFHISGYDHETNKQQVFHVVYAVRTTIDTIRFQPRPKSVGGPIDVLVIKPNEVRWIKRKELNV